MIKCLYFPLTLHTTDNPTFVPSKTPILQPSIFPVPEPTDLPTIPSANISQNVSVVNGADTSSTTWIILFSVTVGILLSGAHDYNEYEPGAGQVLMDPDTSGSLIDKEVYGLDVEKYNRDRSNINEAVELKNDCDGTNHVKYYKMRRILLKKCMFNI